MIIPPLTPAQGRVVGAGVNSLADSAVWTGVGLAGSEVVVGSVDLGCGELGSRELGSDLVVDALLIVDTVALDVTDPLDVPGLAVVVPAHADSDISAKATTRVRRNCAIGRLSSMNR